MNISALSDDVGYLHFSHNLNGSRHSGHSGQHGGAQAIDGSGGEMLLTKSGRPRKIKGEPKEARAGTKKGAAGGFSGSFMDDEEEGAMGTQLDDSNG